MAQPQTITVGLKAVNIGSFIGATNLPELPFGGLSSIDASKYALRIIGVTVIDLPGSDFDNFDDQLADEFNEFLSDPFLSLPEGINISNVRQYNIRNWPLEVLNQLFSETLGDGTGLSLRSAAEAEYIFSDSGVPFEQFVRIITYILGNTGNTSTQGFYALQIECIPFETKEISYGKGGNGRIIAVDTMRDFLSTSMARKHIDALCDSMDMPTPPDIIVVPQSYVVKYSGQRTVLQYDRSDAEASAFGGVATHRGGHKVGQASSIFFNLADSESTSKINSHDSYFAELVFNMSDYGRGEQIIDNGIVGKANDRTNGYGVPARGQSGGYFVIKMNDVDFSPPLGYVFLHELGHCLTVTNILSPTLNDPHLQLGSDSTFSLTFANISDTYKNWRGFGSGTIISFDGAAGLPIPGHPSPIWVNHLLHSCPLIYLRGTDILPMPSDNVMGYPTSQVQGAGSLYREASFLGASCDHIDLPIQGEVLLYEAFISLVNEFAEQADRKEVIDIDEEGFLMFDPTQFNDNLELVKETESLFLKLQILWGGIQARGRTGGFAVNFKYRPNNPDTIYEVLRTNFSEFKIKYDKFEFTQEEEYRLGYSDDLSAISADNVDFFKRHQDYSDFDDAQKEGEGSPYDGDIVYSHVHDDVLDAMEFRVVEDFIEVINGQPRRTFDGIAKYNYIISKAEGETLQDLERSFGSFFGENDAKIKSIFGGEKMAKQMALKNEAGEEECKYVYVVVRPASDLNFTSATIRDDKDRTVTIP